MGERLERVALGRRMVVDDPVERHVVPGRRRLLPESAGRRAHLVGPVRGLVEALRPAEDLAHVRPREPAELRVGDGGDDSVPGLAPGERGRRNAGSPQAATNNHAFIGSGTLRFG